MTNRNQNKAPTKCKRCIVQSTKDASILGWKILQLMRKVQIGGCMQQITIPFAEYTTTMLESTFILCFVLTCSYNVQNWFPTNTKTSQKTPDILFITSFVLTTIITMECNEWKEFFYSVGFLVWSYHFRTSPALMLIV